MSQTELYTRVTTIKRHVRDSIGTKLSCEFRSTHLYREYIALCGNAFLAFRAGQLGQQTVRLLEEYAKAVVALGSARSLPKGSPQPPHRHRLKGLRKPFACRNLIPANLKPAIVGTSPRRRPRFRQPHKWPKRVELVGT